MISRDRINPVVYNWNATKLIKSSGIQFLGLKFLGESFFFSERYGWRTMKEFKVLREAGNRMAILSGIYTYICSSISLSGRHFFRQVFLYFNLIDGNGHDV